LKDVKKKNRRTFQRKYKNNMHYYVIPDITFQEYIRYAKSNYEKSFSKKQKS